jgi:hypothetical protein
MLISEREHKANKECDLKTFFALRRVERRKLFGLGKIVQSTEIVAKTRASNFMWALKQFRKDGVKCDQVIEAKLIVTKLPLENSLT